MIYFLQRDEDNAIKIGCTKRPLPRIMEQLKASKFWHRQLLGTMNGEFELEAELHERFIHLKLTKDWRGHPNRDWFQPSDELLTFIEQSANTNCEIKQEVERRIAIRVHKRKMGRR